MNDAPDPRQRRTGNVYPIRPDVDPDAALHEAAELAWKDAFHLALDASKRANPGRAVEDIARRLIEHLVDLYPMATTQDGRDDILGLLTFAYSDLNFYADPKSGR